MATVYYNCETNDRNVSAKTKQRGSDDSAPHAGSTSASITSQRRQTSIRHREAVTPLNAFH